MATVQFTVLYCSFACYYLYNNIIFVSPINHWLECRHMHGMFTFSLNYQHTQKVKSKLLNNWDTMLLIEAIMLSSTKFLPYTNNYSQQQLKRIHSRYYFSLLIERQLGNHLLDVCQWINHLNVFINFGKHGLFWGAKLCRCFVISVIFMHCGYPGAWVQLIQRKYLRFPLPGRLTMTTAALCQQIRVSRGMSRPVQGSKLAGATSRLLGGSPLWTGIDSPREMGPGIGAFPAPGVFFALFGFVQ